MSKDEKLKTKFFQSPESLRLSEIEKILLLLGFQKIQAKGSHVKWKHQDLSKDIIIPVHNNDCKNFYKKQIYKICKTISQ